MKALLTKAIASKAAIKNIVELYRLLVGSRVPGGAISIRREIVTEFFETNASS